MQATAPLGRNNLSSYVWLVDPFLYNKFETRLCLCENGIFETIAKYSKMLRNKLVNCKYGRINEVHGLVLCSVNVCYIHRRIWCYDV